MNVIWIAALLITASPGEAAPDDSPNTATAAPGDSADNRSPLRIAQDLREKVSDRLRREATTEGADNREAIVELIELYAELMRDEYLTKDERLRLRGKVRSRLLRVIERLEREARLAKKDAQRQRKQPDQIDPPIDFAEILGQQLNNLGQAVGQRGGADAGKALIELIKGTIRPDTWDDKGGPGSIMLYRIGAVQDSFRDLAAGGVDRAAGLLGGAQQDDGEALVELIQTVIAPDSWDTNGGPGTIFYYRPLRVLVIRQTSEVHGNVGDALGQLRRAGN